MNTIFFKNNKAFTLVELIVVITILAVLATVAFVSFQGYGQSSRDSVRLSDIKSMEKIINLYSLTKSRYPTPNDSTGITYSGSTAWTQGVFGINAYTNNTSLSNVPQDPLTGLPYAYSVTNTKKEYQMSAILEGEISNIQAQTYAGDQLANVFVRGDYNGKILKVSTGSIDYLLGVPSILASDITSVDVMDIINNNKLVYKGYKNLPASFSGSQYDNNGGFDFTPNNIILFEGDISDLESDSTIRSTFFDNLQTNYSGTTISSESDIKELLSIKSSAPGQISNYVANTLNNSLKTNIPVVSIADDCNNLKGQYRTSYAMLNTPLFTFINNTYAGGGPEFLPDFELCDNRTVEFGVELIGLSASNGNREVIKLELEYGYEYNITVTTDNDLAHLIYNSDGEIMQSEDFYNVGNLKFTPPISGTYYAGLLNPYWEEGDEEGGEEFGLLDGLFSQTYAGGGIGLYDYIIVKNNSLTRCELGETRDSNTGTCETPISGSCSGIIPDAVYSNGSTSKNIVNATHYNSLTAKFNKVPLSNSCEFTCKPYYTHVYGEPEYECKPPVFGSCTGIVDNAKYYNGNSSSYELSNASYYTSLTADHSAVPVINTCKFTCDEGYGFNGNQCIFGLDVITIDNGPGRQVSVPVHDINVEDGSYLISNFSQGYMAFKVNLNADTTYQMNLLANPWYDIEDTIVFDNNKNEIDNYFTGANNFMYRTEISGDYYLVMYVYKDGPGTQDYNFDINITNDEYVEPGLGFEGPM